MQLFGIFTLKVHLFGFERVVQSIPRSCQFWDTSELFGLTKSTSKSAWICDKLIVRRSPPRRSPPQTFTTPYSKMLHSPPTDIHHQPTFTIPYNNHPRKKNLPTLHQGSRVQSKQWLMICETVKHGKQWKYLCTPLQYYYYYRKQTDKGV